MDLNHHFRVDIEKTTFERLKTYPHLRREIDVINTLERGEVLYEGKPIKSFKELSSHKTGKTWKRGIQEVELIYLDEIEKYQPSFESNCGEWVLLDKPIVAAIQFMETYTPVALLKVTHNGDDAYTVYLQLGECCSDSDNRYSHYYKEGFSWTERPFDKIIDFLKPGKKLCYSFCKVKYPVRTDQPGCTKTQEKLLGGFRVIE